MVIYDNRKLDQYSAADLKNKGIVAGICIIMVQPGMLYVIFNNI